ncbi:cobalamin biosynthesis protein CobG [Streptomyces sp. NPDC001339]|uniref:cobalamin biosynthesis protein CobG n=1 Tax=Streptomyces sp. NPDC001339 TaxID=3364563 RepID=UPI003699ECA6
MPPSPSIRPHEAAPPIRDRGDACPGALRLHSAADGCLARVRVPAGDLTVRQASVLADAADRLGDGHLSLTSRGNIELRGLPDDCGARLAALLRDAGLLPSERHERIRNILASPLAGLDRNTPADVRSWARELDALLCASTSATALSGRFLFVLDDGRGDVATLGGDVTLVAERGGAAASASPAGTGGGSGPGDRSGPGDGSEPGSGSGPGGRSGRGNGSGPGGGNGPGNGRGSRSGCGALLRVGEDPAALRIAGRDAARAALIAAETFLAAAEANGSGAWRVRELPAGQGLTALDVAERLRTAGIAAEYVADAAYAAYAGHMAHAAQGAHTADAADPSAGASAAPSADSSAPGIVEGPDGPDGSDGPDGRHVALSVLAPLGRLSTAQWRLLTATAAHHGSGELRLTPWRGIVVPGLAATTADARLAALSAAGLVTDPSSPWYRLGACTGRPGCAKSRTDVRADAAAAIGTGTPTPGDAPALTAPLATPEHPVPLPPHEPRVAALRDLPVHWSGCERRCGHPHGTWIDVLATPDGYQVSVVRPPHAPPATQETRPQ